MVARVDSNCTNDKFHPSRRSLVQERFSRANRLQHRRTDTGRAAARDFFSLEAVDFDQLQDEVAPEARS
ncbi:MAG: hypothetical protein ACPIOQ_24550 [Promethearchaeia archaeon]